MTIAAIDDVPLINLRSIRWALRDGVRPVIETFDVTPAGADRLRELAPGPVTLRLEVGDGGDVEFNFLYIVGFPPGPNPHIQRVELADRRWIWQSSHVLRRFNMRRRIGSRRVLEPNLPAQLQPVTPELQYRRFSLLVPNAGFKGRWLGMRDAFQNVLAEVLAKESATFGARARIVIKGNFPREIPMENVVIDDDGASAVNRMLAHFPEASLFVAPGGDVVIYSKASGEERETVIRAGSEIVGAGHVELVENVLMRPRHIEVLFSKEIEVRLDFRSGGTSTIVAATDENQIPGAPSGIDNDLLENVLPLPDYKLTIRGKEQTQGNWVAIDRDLLNAWGAPPGLGGPITGLDIRQDAIPFVDLLLSILPRFGEVDPTQNWTPRIAALRQHYRRTFRIHENLMDRIISIKAERVGNVNPSTGQRAPAIAYGDWAVIPSVKYFFRQLLTDTRYVINHSSFAAGDFSIILGSEPGAGVEKTAGSKPMPARISIVDEEQGIIHLDYMVDPNVVFQQVIPGNIENGPSGDVANSRNENVAFNATTVSNRSRPIALDDDFRLAVILTVSPGAPNSNQQLQRIIIRPQQVIPLLPPSLQFNPAEASAPPMTVRIGPGVETARIAWSDSLAPEIFSQFGLGRDIPSPLDSLIVNLDPAAAAESGASLNRIALAEAARIYASFADRFRGQAAMRIRPGIEPTGSLSEVVFEIDRFGVGTVQLAFPERFDPLNFFALLDASTRAVVLQLAIHQR